MLNAGWCLPILTRHSAITGTRSARASQNTNVVTQLMVWSCLSVLGSVFRRTSNTKLDIVVVWLFLVVGLVVGLLGCLVVSV